MKKLLVPAILLVSLTAATSTSAQTFGELFPVTNTRYDTAYSTPRMAANGRDFFLFWAAERKIRATSLAQQDGPRVGHVVLDTSGAFDVAWNGEVFLAAASRQLDSYSDDAHIIGRLLDAEARPLSGELALAEHGREPRIAGGPEAMVMVYRGTAGDTRLLVLGSRGERHAESSRLALGCTYAVAGTDAGFVIALSSTEELRTITLDRQGRAVSEHSLARPSSVYREVALASDGNRYLLAWSGENGWRSEVAAASLDESGSIGTPLVIRDRLGRSLSPVWTGTGWSVSYESDLGARSRVRIAHLDRAAQAVIAEEQSAVDGVESPTLAAVNQRMMAAWNPVGGVGDPTSVIELPLAAHQPRVATYAATNQILLATASSADATLMVWRENGESGRTIHAGLRTHDGRWTETELATLGYEAVAASDGKQFVVIVSGNGQKLIRFDGRGRLLAAPVTLPPSYDQMAIAWNGTHYGIVIDMKGMLLTPSGVLSEPVQIPYKYLDSSFSGKLFLASNGDGFLLVGEELNCIVSICSPGGLNAMRLNASLQRIEAEEIHLYPYSGNPAGVVWNGSEYVVAWSASDSFYTARVPPSASSPITGTGAYENFDVTGIARMPGGGISLTGSVGTSNVTRVVFLRNDGSIARSFLLDSSAVIGPRLLTTVPDGVAYLASSVEDPAPYHGTSHVMMAIARPSIPPPPYPPHVNARLRNGLLLVDWSASAGTVNGYRLEYRVDGGSWNELEEWFPAESDHKAIWPSFGTHYEVRMRAFNDGGASAYSATSTTKSGRRRAAH